MLEKTWQTINNLLEKSYPKYPQSFRFNGDTITHKYDVEKAFNDYFSNIGNLLSYNNQDTFFFFFFNTYLPEPDPYSFNLSPTTLAEAKFIIRNMKVSTPGHD